MIIPFDALWEQYKRIVKPNAAIVLTASQPFTSQLVMSNPEWFKYEWIWEKGRATGFVHAKNKPMKSHENILIFSEGTTVHATQSMSRMKYFPQMEVGEKYERKQKTANTGRLNHAVSKCNLDFIGSVSKNDGERYPRTVLPFSMHNVGNVHPTQKPSSLFEYLIKTYSSEGDLILDNCAGSGTTAIAALNTNRNYLLMEKEAEYIEVIRERIKKHSPKDYSVLPESPVIEKTGQLALF